MFLPRFNFAGFTNVVSENLNSSYQGSMAILFTKHRKTISFYLLPLTIFLVIAMATISLIYIISPRNQFSIDLFTIGIIGWIAVLCATLYLSLNYLKECLLIFIVFFTLGFSTKAYLEPISDQLDHLHRTYEKCDNIDYYGTRFNEGFWQYNMNGVLLCQTRNIHYSTVDVLEYIDTLHALYIGIGSVILYLIGRTSGLPPKWSLLALCLAIFFMGTNKFSYFRYYSYAPSFTSIFIYWIWICFFFFKKSPSNIITGTVFAFLSIIILSVNHLQEAVFLSYILIIWIILNITEKIVCLQKHKYLLFFWGFILFLLFYLLPQYKVFQNILSLFFMTDLWDENKNVVYYWNDFYIFGRIWEQKFRVIETTGIMGFIPLILSPFIIYWYQKNIITSNRLRILLLGILPFLILCTPLFHYIWVSNVYIGAYYRIIYSSLYWYTIALFFYLIEISISKYDFKIYSKILYAFCLLCVYCLGMIRTHPFYGKIDFLLLNGRPWWPTWEALIQQTRDQGNTFAYTDYITSYILTGVFGEKTVINVESNKIPELYIEDMEAGKLPEKQFLNLSLLRSNKKEDYKCIINLIGYQSSWVPDETRHWNSNIAVTSRYYQFKNTKKYSDFSPDLKLYALKKCVAFFPIEK